MSKGQPTTSIATSDATTITVRGYDLVDELIGKYTYTEVLYFLICDRFPSKGETQVLDACLVTLMEHGITPSSLVTRLVLDNVPDETQMAIAAGLTTVGSVFVGTMEDCARLLDTGIREHGSDLRGYCQATASEHKNSGRKVPGFGHFLHKPDDPRSPRLFTVAAEAGVDGRYIDLLKQLGEAVDEVNGRHLTINATGAIAALLLEIGIPVDIIRGIAVVSRAGGLTGHIVEEKKRPAARHIWRAAEEAVPYRNPRGD